MDQSGQRMDLSLNQGDWTGIFDLISHGPKAVEFSLEAGGELLYWKIRVFGGRPPIHNGQYSGVREAWYGAVAAI